jgi:hypothetical protein
LLIDLDYAEGISDTDPWSTLRRTVLGEDVAHVLMLGSCNNRSVSNKQDIKIDKLKGNSNGPSSPSVECGRGPHLMSPLKAWR